MNGLSPFKTKIRKTELTSDLNALKMAILAIAKLFGGVFELRLHFGPGYRIYFGQIDDTLVLLLCGGDKTLNDLPAIGRQQLIISKQ